MVAVPLVVLSCQPKSFNVVVRLPALTSFLFSPLVGAVTLPLLTVRSTVSATSLSVVSSIFKPSPCFTLNLAERPSWSISIPPFSRR